MYFLLKKIDYLPEDISALKKIALATAADVFKVHFQLYKTLISSLGYGY